MFAQKILPALAVFGFAAAQSNPCTQTTVTISSQADATLLASCSTFGGSIVIASTASGTIAIDGPQQIRGNLTCQNAGGLTSLTSTSINSIGGDFRLFNLTFLSTLQMDALTSVNTLYWEALPALSSLNFAGPLSSASSVTISNTFLSTLNGINLNTVGTLQIDNNNNLRQFDIEISNITNSVNINANGNNLAVSFPNLEWAANVTLRNVSRVSFPSLATVNGSLGLYGNYFESLMAPNLTSVGNFATGVGSMALVANGRLANISFPALRSVGGAAQIANNTALRAISFPVLSTCGGAIEFSGNFTTPELPEISDIKGGFIIQSQQVIDCSGFEAQSGGRGSVIQGTYICRSATATTETLDGSTSTTGGASGSGTPRSDAANYRFSEAALGFSVFGGLLQMIL